VTTRTVLVTGGSGTLGRPLVCALQVEGWRVRALVHRRGVPDADEQAFGSLGDPASLFRAVEGCNAVVHAAGATHRRKASDYVAVNVDGTRRIVGACETAGVERFVFVSTRAISPTGGAYSVSKRAGEDIVRSSALSATIVRLAEVYGGNGAEGVDRILRSAQAGARIAIVGHGRDEICPVHVDDVVRACARALDAIEAVGRTYTLAGECMSMRDFAERCVAAFGSDSRIVSIPSGAMAVASSLSRYLPLPLYPDQLDRLRAPKDGASPEAAADLGFDPRPLESSFEQHSG